MCNATFTCMKKSMYFLKRWLNMVLANKTVLLFFALHDCHKNFTINHFVSSSPKGYIVYFDLISLSMMSLTSYCIHCNIGVASTHVCQIISYFEDSMLKIRI